MRWDLLPGYGLREGTKEIINIPPRNEIIIKGVNRDTPAISKELLPAAHPFSFPFHSSTPHELNFQGIHFLTTK